MSESINTTQLESEEIAPAPQSSFLLDLLVGKLTESSGLFVALFIVLISNVAFQSSDSPGTKRFMSLVMGLLILGFLFQYSVCHSLIIATVVYGLNRLLKQRAPIIVLFFTLSYAYGYHQYIQAPQHNSNIWQDLYKFSLIPLICKCISFTFCYADSFKDPSILSADQETRKIATLPSIYHYFAYMFHYLSVFFGPPLDYYDYNNFIMSSAEYTKFERNIPGALGNVGLAFLAFLLYAALTCFVDPLMLFSKGFSDQSSLLDQIYLICAVGLTSRLFYYCAAVFFQAGIELSGLTYNGIDDIGQHHFGRIKVVNRSFLLQGDPSATIQSWNPSYYVWLKRYIYVRIASLHTIRDNVRVKCLAIALALGVSFVVLGFSVGGIIAYVHLFLMILSSSYFHKGKWRLAKLPAIIRLFGSSLKWLYVYFAFSFFAIGIQIKDWEVASSYYKSIAPGLILVELCMLGYFVMNGWGRKETKKKEKRIDTADSDVPKIVDETKEYIERIRRRFEDEWAHVKKNEEFVPN